MRSVARSRVVCSAVVGVLLARTAAASLGPPVSFEALVAASDVIVLGQVDAIASGIDPGVDGIYTYITIQPSEILKGPANDGPIVIKQLGGLVGNRGVHVPGQARFAEGEEVLVFLGARPRDGSLQTIGLWQGKWAIETVATTGQGVATKREPETGVAVETRALSALRLDLEQLAPADRRSGAAVIMVPPERPRQSSPFVLNDPPVRWVQSVVPVHIENGSQPGLAGGGAAEIGAAAAQWNAAGSTLTLSGGGRLPPRCLNSSGSHILVTFNDPCGEISNDPFVLAVAAFGFVNDGGQLINGRLFLPITDAVITTSSNPEARAFLQSSACFQSVIAHEIGHAIGLDHAADPTALMSFVTSASCFQFPTPVGPDDRAGLFVIYPPGGAPMPGATPGQATVISAAAAGATLNIAWTSGPGATPSSHRLDFFSGAAMVASLTVGPATTVAIPIPPGTQGSFAVRVTAFAGAAAGPPSALFSFVLAGGGGGGCSGPPAAPVVSGSVQAGTATVSWGPVSGATSYLVSAGTTPGAGNLYAPANVGSSTSVSASGLPAGFSAWVRVVAINACGQSPPADFFLSGLVPPNAGASIQFETTADTCSCWTSPISLEVDGSVVGSMACSGAAAPFPVSPGPHSYRACDSLSCHGNTQDVASGTVLRLILLCE
jgi:hypothetical protein